MPGSQEFVDLNQQPEPLTPQHPDKMNTALLWCLQGMEAELPCEESLRAQTPAAMTGLVVFLASAFAS